jgi:Icc-related predicted phosphoesterase
MRLYYASDIHGSRKCWLKFLATPKYYGADVIIIGGDITGKFIVPMIRKPDGRVETVFMGRKRKLKKEDEVEKIKEQMANAGQYGVDMTQDEYDLYVEDPSRIGDLFQRALYDRVAEWAKLADERLSGSGVRCFVSPGNDDEFVVDEALAKAETIEVHDGRVVELGDGFQMIGVGYANITPWNCPRDITEDELAEKIEALAAKIARMDRAVFDIHVPPYDTGIDEAPELTEDKQVVSDGMGAPIMTPVGSTAVREAILRHQPLLGLHGHIHEAAGIRRLGATTVINPGSEYGEGLLRGALVELDEKEGLVSANLVTG